MSRGHNLHRKEPKIRRLSKDLDRLKTLRKRVSSTTQEPGIYRWLDEKETVLYVGKAKNLRKRLAWYVSPKPGAFVGPWKESFLKQIADFDVTVVNNELEALILETNLIKELRPKYNVLMKDDKNYLFIRISVQDPYPRVEPLRKVERDGSKFFGPYLNSRDAYETLEILQAALNYRACEQSVDLFNKKGDVGRTIVKPCLEFQIGRCNGLCAGAITPEEYLKRIEEVIAFLNGKKDVVRERLKEKMTQAAADRKFELAAKIRNYLAFIEGKKEENQIISDGSGEDSDIIGTAILSNRVHVVVMHRRNGRLIGESHFALNGQALRDEDVLEQFLPQYYDDGIDVPPSIVIGADFPSRGAVAELLSIKRGSKVKIPIPERGRTSHLLQLAEKNAMEKARQHEVKWEAEQRNTEEALTTLQTLLSLPSLPKRIEGYDISHLGGTETVGSMVVALNGKAANDHYRSFTIKTMKTGEVDDYRALREVLTRRLRRLVEDVRAEEKVWEEQGIVFRKAKKAEQETLEHIHDENAEDITPDAIDYHQYLVAVSEDGIIGFARTFEYPGKITTIRSLWVSDDWRERNIGQFIVRKILRGIKKGKIYIHAKASLEEYYASVGFRYVITPPKILAEQLEKFHGEHPDAEQRIVMMWDAFQNKSDLSLCARPDLLMIDGGKGQLGIAVDVLQDMKLDIPVIGLAKREEEIFVPRNSIPIQFPKDSPAKFLLMRLRDEAHRFANRHREKRGKKTAIKSALDDIPGMGEKTKAELLKKFGTISGIREASDEELMSVLSEEQMRNLRENLA